MPTNNQHLAEADLERYSMHAMSVEACARVEQHLLACQICRGRLVDTDDYVAAMKSAARELPGMERTIVKWSWNWPGVTKLTRTASVTELPQEQGTCFVRVFMMPGDTLGQCGLEIRDAD